MQGMFWAQGRARILGMALATEISREGMAGIKIGKTRVAADGYFFRFVCACVCALCLCAFVHVYVPRVSACTLVCVCLSLCR